MSRIVLAGSTPAFEHVVRRILAGDDIRTWSGDPAAVNPAEAAAGLAAAGADVVAIGPGVSVLDALDLARALDASHPELAVLLVAEPGPSLWEPALRAGVRDVLSPGANDTDLEEAFRRALNTVDRLRSTIAGELQPAAQRGRVITVVSPKGGAGKTTITTNLAVGLALHSPGQAVLVDLDLEFGDVANALQIIPEHTLGDIAGSPDALDITALKVHLARHSSGLYALCAPVTPEQGEAVDPKTVETVIRMLADEFPYVLVDTSGGLSEETLTALDLATDILLVADMDVSSVKALRKALDALDRLGMTHQRRHFVINRSDSRVGLSVNDIEATVGLDVEVQIPSSRAVPLSLNQGTPVIQTNPRSPVGRQLTSLIERFSDNHVIRAGGFLRRWGAA